MKRILMISLLWGLSAVALGLNPYGFETYLHIGHVMVRAPVTTEDGQPIWAEYNDQGGHSRLTQLDGQRGVVRSATEIRAYQLQLTQFQEQYQNAIEILAIDEFKNTEVLTADDRPITDWPSTPEEAMTIVLPAKEKRFNNTGRQIDHYFFPVSESMLHAPLGENVTSLFFDEEGNEVYRSDERIGLLTAYHTDSSGEVPNASEYEAPSGLISMNRDDYEVLGPVSSVQIEAIGGLEMALGVSDSTGSYSVRGRLNPCPGFSYTPEIDAYARLNYSSFHPRGAPAIPYYLRRRSYNLCIGYGASPPGFSLGGLMAQANVIGIISSAPENNTVLNYAVGIHMLVGQAVLAGVEVAERTEYYAEESPKNPYDLKIDYDGDGEPDTTGRGRFNEEGQFVADANGDRYGVIFSGSPRSDGQPNITRIVDYAPHVADTGLLKTISEDDFKDTDIMVFRESTGELIVERSGLKEDENYIEGDTSVSTSFNYGVAIRSPEDMIRAKPRNSGNFVDFQAKQKVNKKFQSYEADFIRTGERIRVVMINRATGYIGSALTTLTPTGVGGNISVYVPPIVMGPPNLKIWTTRRFDREGLLADADELRRTISNEGAATTDDNVIEVHTEWLDSNGYPLPAGLKTRGYTGRVTRQVATDGDIYDGGVKEFAIDPGRQLQKLDFDNNQAFHHYVQVNAKPLKEQNDFSTGDHTGVLRHRPSHYVPVKVPLYDEQGTEKELADIRKSQQESEGKIDIDLDEVPSRHYWVYRPELSFSVVDLAMEQILAGKSDGNGGERIDIHDEKIPVINSSDDVVELIFNLTTSEFERITPLEGEREYILSLGGEEIHAKVNPGGGDQTVTFENLEHLGSLEAEDYLTLSLYLNNDSRNVLWEWAFEYLALGSRVADNELETSDTYYVSADDPVIPLFATIVGYGGRDEEEKEPRSLAWVTDEGKLSKTSQTNDDTGVFTSELTLPNKAGTKAKVYVELKETNRTAEFKTIEVIPGEPHRIALTKVGDQVGVLGSAQVSYEAVISDAHGNLVADGTLVNFDVSGYARVVASSDVTANGKAYVKITGTERFDDQITMQVRSGNATASAQMASRELGVTIDVASNLTGNESATATIRVTNPAGNVAGLPVTLSAPNLGLSNTNIVTDSRGRAQVDILVPDYNFDSYIHARVGYAGADRVAVSVAAQEQNQYLKADNYQPILAEKDSGGSFSYNRFDGQNIDIGYRSGKTLSLRGEPGSQVPLTLGDAFYPNRMPLFSLTMDSGTVASAGFNTDGFPLSDAPAPFADDTEKTALVASNIALSGQSPNGLSRSVDFNGISTIESGDSNQFKVAQPNWAFSVKPDGEGNIIALGNEQSISFDGSHFIYQVTTDTGIYQVEAPGLRGKWQQLAARVRGGQLELFVDDFTNPVTTPITGTLPNNHRKLVIGDGFSGQLSTLRFYDQSSEPLLEAVTADGSVMTQGGSINLGGANIAEIQIRSLANFNRNDQKLDIAYVHVVAGSERVHIPLMSEDAYKQIAELKANSGQIGPALAAYSGSPYSNDIGWVELPFSSVMPQAYAYSLFDVVDLFIPLSSIRDIIDQAGKIGTEDFDPVLLLISSLDVVLVFSGPLKPVLSAPLKAIKPLLKNPAFRRVVNILGPFLANIMGKVVDSRSLSPVVTLMPMLLIIGEIAIDPESRDAIGIIINAISSSDDLQVWFDYFNLPSDGWDGDVIPELELDLTAQVEPALLPLAGLINPAYAVKNPPKRKKGPKVGKDLNNVAESLKRGEVSDDMVSKAITDSMESAVAASKTASPDMRQVLTNPTTLKAGGALALSGISKGLKNILNYKSARTPAFLQLAAIAYLESRMSSDCDGSGCISDSELHKKIRRLYGKSLGAIVIHGHDSPVSGGYQFQLAMVALLNAWGEHGSPYGKLIDIERQEKVKLWRYKSNERHDKVKAYSDADGGDFLRSIDIVTEKDGVKLPVFIELKSYKGQTGSAGKLDPLPLSSIKSRFSAWKFTTGKKGGQSTSAHRQYILDKILSTNNELIEKQSDREEFYKSEKIYWLFQSFKLKTVGGLTNKQIEAVREKLALNAAKEPAVVSASLGLKKYSKKVAEDRSKKEIDLFNFITVVNHMGDQFYNELFDMNNLSEEEKSQLKSTVEELVLSKI